MTKRILNSFVAAAIVLVLAGVSYNQLRNRDQGLQATSETESISGLAVSTITVGDRSFTVELATTPAEQSLGLSGRPSMAIGHGMFFLFDDYSLPSFWMKDMQFALDFVWIADGRVVDITRNISAPNAGTSDSDLEIYRPSSPVDGVLELNAGESEGLNIGDSVERVKLLTN